MAGCQNDATNGFDFSDDAGHRGGGENAVLPDDQAANLKIKEQTKLLWVPNPKTSKTAKPPNTGDR